MDVEAEDAPEGTIRNGGRATATHAVYVDQETLPPLARPDSRSWDLSFNVISLMLYLCALAMSANLYRRKVQNAGEAQSSSVANLKQMLKWMVLQTIALIMNIVAVNEQITSSRMVFVMTDSLNVQAEHVSIEVQFQDDPTALP